MPSASGTMRAATAARGAARGAARACARDSTGCGSALGSRSANGVVASLPIGTAPAPRSRATDGASTRRGAGGPRGRARRWWARPAASKMSFSATGTPWSGPMKRPSRASMSRCTATRAAASRSRRTHAPTAGSTASMRLRQDASRLDGDSAPGADAPRGLGRRPARAWPPWVSAARPAPRRRPRSGRRRASGRRRRERRAHLAEERLGHLDPRAQPALARLLHARPHARRAP